MVNYLWSVIHTKRTYCISGNLFIPKLHEINYSTVGLLNWVTFFDFGISVENCRKAMELAETVLDIPMVLEPEYLASPYLDDLSGMTYLSYFMKENSPGFHATLRWVQSQIPDQKISNFTVQLLPLLSSWEITIILLLLIYRMIETLTRVVRVCIYFFFFISHFLFVFECAAVYFSPIRSLAIIMKHTWLNCYSRTGTMAPPFVS